jgi:hypothetical protein
VDDVPGLPAAAGVPSSRRSETALARQEPSIRGQAGCLVAAPAHLRERTRVNRPAESSLLPKRLFGLDRHPRPGSRSTSRCRPPRARAPRLERRTTRRSWRGRGRPSRRRPGHDVRDRQGSVPRPSSPHRPGSAAATGPTPSRRTPAPDRSQATRPTCPSRRQQCRCGEGYSPD